MRMLLRVTIPAESGNAAIRDGSIQRALQTTMEQLRPEAAYFLPLDGHRTAMFFFEMQSQADVVHILEPFWLNLEADIDLVPAMSFNELQTGLGSLNIEHAMSAAEEDAANPIME